MTSSAIILCDSEALLQSRSPILYDFYIEFSSHTTFNLTQALTELVAQQNFYVQKNLTLIAILLIHAPSDY